MKAFLAPKFLSRALPALVVSVVPVAAFLAFSIQPMLGKRLLPIYGGTAGTWLGCMVYFQAALLLGYSWAAWLVRKSVRFQVNATVLLALVAVVTFSLPDDDPAATASIARVVWRLAVATLPAMVLLFSCAPLLHAWMRRRGQEVPYYIYAISNVGSLAAVLLYPFLVETNLRLSEQAFYWHALLFIVTGLLAAAGFVLKQSTEDASAEPAPEPAATVPLGTAALWLWLSALTCIGMLGATYHIAAEIGSNPVAWVGPFGVYLLSFAFTFSGRWRRWMTLTTIVLLAISLTGFMVTKGFTAKTVNAERLLWLVLLTAAGSFLGNAIIHSLRPAERFERFYLFLAAGGVLGGLISAVVIPRLLSQPIEFELASVALLATGMIWLTDRRDPATITVTACVLLAPVLGLGFSQSAQEAIDNSRVRHVRDLYGHIMIKTDNRSVVLSSDTTTHGTQITTDATTRRHPTLYYSESSGVGRVIQKLQADRPQMTVGVIGLGAGTLAAYARKDDVYDFWDIDPKAVRVARENFTYVAESPGKIAIIQCDGRKGLQESKTNYDVLVIDAFTGDGVPAHLLTREAMTVYLRRLAVKNGVLLVHASTRYSTLFPVVEATARTLGCSSIDVNTDISESGADRDWDPTHTEYIIACRPDEAKSIIAWFPDEEDKGRVKHQVATVKSPLVDPQLIWSDERNAELDVLDLGRYLTN